jgi:tRNA A22 N-methylase
MTKPERLRKFLSDNGFAIDNWRLCREKGRIRECLRVKKATPENALRPETDPLYLRVGRKTPETAPLYPEYIHNARRRLEKELHGKTSAGRDLAEIEHIRQLLERLSGLLA